MIRFAYTVALWLLLPWVVLHLLWRGRRQPEYLKHWGERFGFHSRRPQAPTIWLHAVSVGETRAAQPLVAAIRRRYPDHRILLTHMTPTGRQTSEELFGLASDGIERIYLPYDYPFAVRRFLDHYRPQLGLIMETELWPNLIAACRARSVPLALVNARLSARSARRYARFPALTRGALGGLAAIAAQNTTDAERLRVLGAPRVEVFGNVKFDIDPPATQLELARAFRARSGERPVCLAASTREGEETLLLDAWMEKVGTPGVPPAGRAGEATALQGGRARNALLAVADGGTANSALLVIVPRHPQRFGEVAALIESRGLRLQRRSDGEAVAPDTQVWLGDSMGEMFAYYASADVAFIGGSLLDFGSQNLIEACAVGTPVLLGPSTYNFAGAAQDAIACGAAQQLGTAEEIVVAASRLLADAAQRRAMRDAGLAFAARHRGATQRTMALVEQLIRAGR
ncbi:MAG: 3-deoxy-D-manno-octulosonic acid transferase [Gammaproteobacteria bacterium]|nr:3-deoxy-D-manno-octulosonic acid transferase [Gammaproteobacteria bacterium]MBU1647605.1 3-deoxy-D-manno-octulosonic acid transferase [Gammaproteobacteria bacterium]MBU1971494.1 3-deoxy-D-manno-octulosonic acid transferase [Gammaproteobacteria bacterium]